ncbi:MAG TPA: DNA-binding protein WhiA [Oscillospiraceae bacterium]|nr:DNA-binding protein WhiA [Oscillospiraceae bacterium]HPF55029.1 DNA-binding protein WhiA [Clostridiales bacterium]HPK35801.1 DNA-binding protein WhiA [Oscillospiraceae bacterium]HPR75421.1 DNA-binding protein WhiA [Oscillospiraceae bacterium]
MSFCNEVKTKLCTFATPLQYGRAFGSGLLFLHAGRQKNYLLRTEISEAVIALGEIFERETGYVLPVELRATGLREYRLKTARSPKMRAADPMRALTTVDFAKPVEKSRTEIFNVFRLFNENGVLDESLFENPEAAQHFLRGAFISTGLAADPAKDFHLEFSGLTERAAGELSRLLETLEFRPLTTKRGEKWAVYFKDGEQIEYLLAALGDTEAMFELSNLRILRDISNNLNRQMNFDAANLGKSRDAAAKHIAAIKYIITKRGIDHLPPELRATASARIENDDASLSELGVLLGIGRSGVNHRLAKIVKLAEELAVKEGDAL